MFQGLHEVLRQPISCRVIRTSCDVFDVVKTGESLKSFGCKLWAIVSDNLSRDAPSSNNSRSSSIVDSAVDFSIRTTSRHFE